MQNKKISISKQTVLLIFCLFLLKGFGQANDSLWNIWQDESAADTIRLKALRNYNYQGFLLSQPDSGAYFARLEYEYAQQHNNDYYKADALNFIGISFYLKGELDSATQYYENAIKGFDEINNKLEILRINTNLGAVYMMQGNYSKTIEKFTDGLSMLEIMKDTLGQAQCLSNIAAVYISMGQHMLATEYCEKAIEKFQYTSDKIGLATTINNLGAILFEKKKYLKAKDKFNEALKIRKEINDLPGIGASILNLGTTELRLKNYKIAEKQLDEALEIFKKTKNQLNQLITLNSLGSVYDKTGRRKKAINIYERCLKSAQENSFTEEIKNSAFALYEIHKLKKPRLSLEMHELYIEMRDSVESQENQQEVIRQKFKYEYEKQAVADSISNVEKEKVMQAELQAEKIEKKAQQTQNVFLWVGIGIVSLFGLFLYNRFKVTEKQKKIIEVQKEEVDNALKIVEEKNREIMDSIVYAKRIQTAILPTEIGMKSMLPDSFVIYMPKDIVAGDFYWMEQNGSQPGQILVAVADCTGHGVPGAMVSVVCNNGLNRSVREHLINEPGKILDKTREIVVEEFGKSTDKVNDGMDIALISIKDRKLKYAGANNPLWVVRGSEIIEIKANKQPIGNFESPTPYETHEIDLQKEDYVYIFTDGFVDQFGGEKGKKYKPANLRKVLLAAQGKSMKEQKEIITEEFNKWKGSLEQVDDVCLLGIKIS